MQILAVLCTAVAGIVGAALWTQLVYRLALFTSTYRCQVGANHVADGVFLLVYIACAAGAVTAAAGAWMARRTWLRIVAGGVGAVVLLAGVGFFAMHQTGALVEYEEFLKVYGP